MEIVEVSSKEFLDIVGAPYHIYASPGFNELNSEKCERVHYLLFRDGKYRLALAGGRVMDEFRSPFSAPFGGFVFFSDSVSVEYIDKAIEALESWTRSNGMIKIRITLPPLVYHGSFVSKMINGFHRAHFSIEKIDLNHAFSLDTFDSSYVQQICHNARRNLKQSFLYGLRFEWINKIELKAEAYDIIRKNRVDKGYPLRMSFEDLINTGEVIQSDFFLVRTGSGNPVASSLVFHVSSDIVQVIYWGHLLEHNGSKVMNFMSFKIFEYYKELNKKVVDIGPSTQDSLPNNGLCRFKESLGCNVSLKHTFYKDLF